MAEHDWQAIIDYVSGVDVFTVPELQIKFGLSFADAVSALLKMDENGNLDNRGELGFAYVKKEEPQVPTAPEKTKEDIEEVIKRVNEKLNKAIDEAFPCEDESDNDEDDDADDDYDDEDDDDEDEFDSYGYPSGYIYSKKWPPERFHEYIQRVDNVKRECNLDFNADPIVHSGEAKLSLAAISRIKRMFKGVADIWGSREKLYLTPTVLGKYLSHFGMTLYATKAGYVLTCQFPVSKRVGRRMNISDIAMNSSFLTLVKTYGLMLNEDTIYRTAHDIPGIFEAFFMMAMAANELQQGRKY